MTPARAHDRRHLRGLRRAARGAAPPHPLDRRCDHRLQPGRGGRRDHGRHDRVLGRADRLRPRLDDRGALRGRCGMAVHPTRPGTMGEGHAPRDRSRVLRARRLRHRVVTARAALTRRGRALAARHRRSRRSASSSCRSSRSPSVERVTSSDRRPRWRTPSRPSSAPTCRRRSSSDSSLNSLFGWWWADAVAGLVIAVFAVREGVEAWRGDACATSVGMLIDENED